MTREPTSLTPWTEAEANAVREALIRTQDRLAVGVAPWVGLRRRRRRARTARFAGLAGVAAVGCGVFALATGVFSGQRDTVAVVDPSASTVGSLAGDTAFLAELRARALAERGSTGDGATSGRGAGPRVLLATDVPGGRIALVLWSDRQGRAEGAQWITGPEGAPAPRMFLTDTCDLSRPCWIRYGEGWTYLDDRKPEGSVVREQRRGDGVVIAAPPGSQVTVRSVNDITAEGRVRRLAVAATERWRGVFVAPLPTAGGRQDLEVASSGSTWRDSFFGGFSEDLDAWWVNASTVARGTPITDRVSHGDLITAAERATAMAASNSSRVLLQTSTASTSRAVLALHGESGGWVLVAVHRTQTTGNSMTVAVDALSVLPAGDPTTACFAWREPPATNPTLNVLGPAQAVRAELTSGNTQQVGTIDLAQGVGTAPAATSQSATSVRLLDRDNRPAGQCEISPPWPESQVLK